MNSHLRHCVRTVLPALFAVGVMAMQPLAAAERTYKWVDEKGQVHYGGTPPPGIKAEQIAGPPPPPTGAKSDGGASSAKLFDPKKAPPAQAGGAKPTAAEEQVKKENCEAAKKNLDAMRTYARVKVTDENGTVSVLSDEQKAAKIKEMEDVVKRDCASTQ